MKILFAVMPYTVTWNHGVALLSAIAREEGAETALAVLNEGLERFASKLFDFQPDLVAFSGVTVHDTPQLLPAASLAHDLGYRTALGGVFCRHSGAKKPEFVDVLCRGEAESAMRRFVRTGDLDSFLDCEPTADLNSLPLPDYGLFSTYPMEDRGIPYLIGKRILPYHSSRGCRHSCSFCLAPHQGRTVRIRTSVREDLEVLWTGQHDILLICDEIIPYWSVEWRKSWGDLSIPFAGYIRADIKPLELKWLIRHGMVGCAFGVESGDERYRNEVLKKNLTDSDLWRTVALLNAHNIEYAPFFMAGTPLGDDAEAEATLDIMAKIGGHPVLWQYEQLFIDGG